MLSINLSLVDHAEVMSIASQLGFKPEIIQVARRKKTELHALLWQGAIEDTPLNLDKKVDALADQINADAIHYAAGAWTHSIA